MALRMDNVGIVVEDLAGAIEFFRELGLELEGRGLVEGEWAGRVTGLGDQRVEIAMMRTPGRPRPDSNSRASSRRRCRRSPERAGERPRLPTSDVRRGRHRRHARPASQHGAQLVSKRSGPVRGLRTGSATSAGPKAFSSGSPKNSAESYLRAVTDPLRVCPEVPDDVDLSRATWVRIRRRRAPRRERQRGPFTRR